MMTWVKNNSDKISWYLFALLIVSIFFPVKKLFIGTNSFLIGQYSDFTTYVIYFSDILLGAWCLYLLIFQKVKYRLNKIIKILLLWLLFVFITNIHHNIYYNLYFLVKFLELIVLHETVKAYFIDHPDKKTLFLKFFSLLGGLQAVIGLAQFWIQHNLGLLHKLGEPILSPILYGVAKGTFDNAIFIRAYGTFPHPNLLAVFLFCAIISQFYLLTTENRITWLRFYSANLCLLIFGLIITFSRSAFLAAGLALILFFGLYISKFNIRRKSLLRPTFIAIMSAIIGVVILWPAISPRVTISDNSSKERLFYNKIGLNIVKNNWHKGIGLGQSVLHMEQFSPTALKPWEIQPIHNYYLISAAELGIGGALLLIIVFLSYWIKLLRSIWNSRGYGNDDNNNNHDETAYRIALFTIFSGFLLLMLFDHYFYTLQQTQFLLWIILGLIAAEINKARPQKTVL